MFNISTTNIKPITFSAYYSDTKPVNEILRDNAKDQAKPWQTHGNDGITYANVGTTKHVWTKGDAPSTKKLQELGNPPVNEHTPYYFTWKQK